jgi:hypothetical protein
MTQSGEIFLMMDAVEGVPYRLAELRAVKLIIESNHQLWGMPPEGNPGQLAYIFIIYTYSTTVMNYHARKLTLLVN